MNHLSLSNLTREASQLTDDSLAQAGTLGIVTASLMAILIFML